MIGAVLVAIGLVIVLPAIFWAALGVVAAIASATLTTHAEATHAGSDLIATNT